MAAEKSLIRAENKIYFYSGPGLRLAGHIYLPDDYKKGERRSAIVLCHGQRGFKELFMPHVAQRLTKEGYVVLAFDYRGIGDSEGPRERHLPMEQVEDISNAVTYLQNRPEVNPERIGAWGTSFGCGTAIVATALDKRIKCTVGCIGFANGERYLRRQFGTDEKWNEFLRDLEIDKVQRALTGKSSLKQVIREDPRNAVDFSFIVGESWGRFVQSMESLEAVMQFRPEDFVGRISPRPLLLVAAGNDTLIDPSEMRTLYEKAREPKRLYVIDGIGHYQMYQEPFFSEQMCEAVSFFKENLPPIG